MSAGLGSIISSPAAGMSPLRAAAAVVSDGGGEIVPSPRRPQVDEERPKPNPTSTMPHDSYRSFALRNFMRPAHAASLITKLPRSAGAPGRCDYLNGRSGDRPESSKNRRPERLRFLCANAC